MKRIIALATFLMAALLSLPAQTITIKVASQAPENTPIGDALSRLASQWRQISGGQLVLRVYHNGSQGDEDAMKQKMSTGLLDGALFDSFGLSHISPETMALCAPAVIADDAELDYVLSRVSPLIKSKIEDKGFKVMALVNVGWVRFYSKYSISTPTDLRKYKIAVNPYEKELIQLYKLAGLDIVLSPLTTMLQQLQTQAVDVFYTTPMYLSFQWSTYQNVASRMTDLKVCPVIGGIVISKRAYDKIPAAYRDKIMEATDKFASDTTKTLIAKENWYISELAKAGQVDVPVNAAADKEWRSEFADAVRKGTGTVFTKEMMDAIYAAQAAYKAGKK